MTDQLRKERAEATRRLRAENRRAVRAEGHLRDALALLAEIRESTEDPDLRDRIERTIASRRPSACGVRMSCYTTCDLGTHGCLGDHGDEGDDPPVGRLTLPVRRVAVSVRDQGDGR